MEVRTTQILKLCFLNRWYNKSTEVNKKRKKVSTYSSYSIYRYLLH